MKTGSVWRPMLPEDISDVLNLADKVHPTFPEDAAVFTERQRLYPAGSFVLDHGGRVTGYLLSHPWQGDTPPALNSLLHSLPAKAGTYYLHDLALLPAARGTGAAAAIIERVIEHARHSGFPSITLVAVNGSVPFWKRFGFDISDTQQGAKLVQSYDGEARLMVRSLAAS